MRVKGIHSYISKNIPEAVRVLTLNEITNDVRARGDKPKILICCRSFFNYFKKKVANLPFGGRHNLIAKEFESFLAALKDAGAELIFVFKKNIRPNEQRWTKTKMKIYSEGQAFVQRLEEIGNTRDLIEFCRRNANSGIFDTETGLSVTQSAMKFGGFQGNDLFMIKTGAGHIEMANEENALAIVGLDSGYMFYEGHSKLWSAEEDLDSDIRSPVQFKIKQYDKQVILDYFGMNFQQFQLLAILTPKYCPEDIEPVSFFRRLSHSEVIEKVKRFIHECVTFPLTRESIELIVVTIFGDADPEIVKLYEEKLHVFKMSYFDANGQRYHDEAVNALVFDDPYRLAELILNKQDIGVDSPFLGVDANDMQPVSTLITPWIRRTMGMMLKNEENDPKTRYMMVQTDKQVWERVLIKAEYPTFVVPHLTKLIAGAISTDEKFQILSFLIGDIITEEKLKEIPIEYLMHTIILVHLTANDSLLPFEARAFTKTLKDVYEDRIPHILIYPEKVNVRAFRTSYLYLKMYNTLASCFSAIGLKDFITGFWMDNVQYQIYYQESMDEEDADGDVLDQVMTIIQQ